MQDMQPDDMKEMIKVLQECLERKREELYKAKEKIEAMQKHLDDEMMRYYKAIQKHQAESERRGGVYSLIGLVIFFWLYWVNFGDHDACWSHT